MSAIDEVGAFAVSREPLSENTAEVAKRMLYNVIGTAVGAIVDGRVDSLIELGREVGGARTTALPGGAGGLDEEYAALVLGAAAHAEDFDDTHMRSIVHPAASIFGALYAVTEPVDGAVVLRAFAAGCEVQIRMALCLDLPVRELHPASFTGMFGTVGAAVAVSCALGLDEARAKAAVGYAMATTIGSRQSLGTFAKPLHAGTAASNGLAAARLASILAPGIDGDPFTSEWGIFPAVFDGAYSVAPLLDGLGTRWELEDIALKPYPCGVLLHPLIDAALDLHGRVPAGSEVRQVTVTCSPMVAHDTGIANPSTPLEAKFSATHAFAAAFIDGELGLPQYAEERVLDRAIAAVRLRLVLEPEDSLPKDAVHVRLELADGTVLTSVIDHARGSIARPLTHDDLIGKVDALVRSRLPGRAAALWDAVAALDDAAGLTAVKAQVEL